MSHPDTEHGAAGPAAAEEESGAFAVEVVGSLDAARFPGLCVRCGARTDGRLRVAKLFWHDGGEEGSSYHYTAAVDAPACSGCVRAHEGELRPIPREVKRRLLRSWLVASLPYFVPLAVCAWLLAVMAPELLEALAGGEPAEVAIWGAVCGFFAIMALVFFRMIMRGGRPLVLAPNGTSARYAHVERGPLGSRYVVPAEPTSLTGAFDFSDDESALFEPERHRFTFRNGDVAAEFAELNAHRDWDPASTRAQLALRARLALKWGGTAALVLVGLYLLVEEYLR